VVVSSSSSSAGGDGKGYGSSEPDSTAALDLTVELLLRLTIAADIDG